MGNVCCPKKEQLSSQLAGAKPSKVQLEPITTSRQDNEFQLCGIRMIVKSGQVLKEAADAIVFGTDNFFRNRSNTIATSAMVDKLNLEIAQKRGHASAEPLRSGEVITSGPCGMTNVNRIVHLAVPIWRGGKHREEEILVQGFTSVLKESAKEGSKSIIFTDITSTLFGIPKQLSAKALVTAVCMHGKQSGHKIEQIKIIHSEEQAEQSFVEQIKREAEKSQPVNLNDSTYSNDIVEHKMLSNDKQKNQVQSNNNSSQFSINKNLL